MNRPAVYEGVLSLLQPLLELLVVFLFVTTFVFQTTRIPSPSMAPTLRVGDTLLVDKQSFAPRNPRNPLAFLLPPTTIQRGDLAVFYFPADPSRDLVKRVVALPGDRIFLHHGTLFLNGAPLTEPYATHTAHGPDIFRDEFPSFRSTDPNLDPLWWATLRRTVRHGELTVPPGRVFVLGDNRDNSEDSRYWGFVPMRNMAGRPLLVYLALPPAAAGRSPTLRALLANTLHAIRIVR